MRGNVLTAIMQAELEAMLSEGFEKSPITAATLHARLKNKGFVKGGLSTLSTTQRKLLIEEYRDKQISQSDLSQEERKTLRSHKRQSVAHDKVKVGKVECETCAETKRQLTINAIKVTRIIEQAEKVGIDTDKLFADLIVKE